MSQATTIRLVIVDDHEVVREGLKALFDETGIEVLGTAATGAEATDLCARLRPDVVLLDIRAIKAAVEGGSPHQRGELRLMTSRIANRTLPDGIEVPLTPRETQVLRVIAMGLSNQEIADALTISVETVKEHVQNLLRKLAVNDRTQAAVWAVRQGIG
ncbi:MAG: DNA-binding response regulator [Planctomycetia bacterium]|nr:DNA-binding response regulator [Planctomycetia bacterium]